MGLGITSSLKEKIIKDMATVTILSFIKEKENDRMEISKDTVAKYMSDKEICSRPTTLKLIDSLLQAEILLDRGRGRRNSSDLVVNNDFDYEGLMKDSFDNYIKQVKKSIEPYSPLIKKGVIKLDKMRKDPKVLQVPLDVE
jgi:hypothetical protein